MEQLNNRKTYLVLTSSTAQTDIELVDGSVGFLDGATQIGRYEATSKNEALNEAKSDLLEWDFTEADVQSFELLVYELGKSEIETFSFSTVVSGYEFPETEPLDLEMDGSLESRWRQAIQHTHFGCEDGRLDEWVQQGVKQGYVDLASNYRLKIVGT